MDKKTIAMLRSEYPVHVPLKVAAPLLGVSDRQLAKLVAEGREPFADIGAKLAFGVKIYTERLIAYLSGESMYE